VRSVSADDVAIQLAYASKVIIVPGYGLAAAQAQHELADLAQRLEERGVDVSYAIHPVAGRMPGHMNVLLAEANVPYPQLKDMEDVNPHLRRLTVEFARQSGLEHGRRLAASGVARQRPGTRRRRPARAPTDPRHRPPRRPQAGRLHPPPSRGPEQPLRPRPDAARQPADTVV